MANSSDSRSLDAPHNVARPGSRRPTIARGLQSLAYRCGYFVIDDKGRPKLSVSYYGALAFRSVKANTLGH